MSALLDIVLGAAGLAAERRAVPRARLLFESAGDAIFDDDPDVAVGEDPDAPVAQAAPVTPVVPARVGAAPLLAPPPTTARATARPATALPAPQPRSDSTRSAEAPSSPGEPAPPQAPGRTEHLEQTQAVQPRSPPAPVEAKSAAAPAAPHRPPSPQSLLPREERETPPQAEDRKTLPAAEPKLRIRPVALGDSRSDRSSQSETPAAAAPQPSTTSPDAAVRLQPRPLSPAAPVAETALRAGWREPGAEPPRLEISIGRIDIEVARPVEPAPQAARRGTPPKRGFEGYRAARRGRLR